jgi:rhamnosyltransferase
LDKLIIWKNSPDCDDVLPKERVDYADKIVEMDAGSNVGLAKPYNAAIAYAREHRYTHLLTMDQDSFFEEGGFRKYLDIVLKIEERAVFIPNYVMGGKKSFPFCEEIVETDLYINSGTLYPLSVFDTTGTFREDFFMDSIDIDIALRAKGYGIPWKGVCSILLYHEMGNPRKRKFFWKTVMPHEFSSMRLYYCVRNGLILKSLYPNEKLRDNGHLRYLNNLLRWCCRRLLLALLYGDKKWAKVEGMITGYIHGKRGITGIRKRYHPDIPDAK